MRNVFTGLLPTEARRGKNLCGIRELEGVESTANALHGGEIRLGKHFRHHGLLFFADTVFSRDRAACRDTKLKDLKGKRESGFFLAGDAAVIENERMEITVASMKNIGDTQAVFVAEPLDFAHYLRKRGARDHTVLDEVVGGDTAHGGEGRFAPF